MIIRCLTVRKTNQSINQSISIEAVMSKISILRYTLTHIFKKKYLSEQANNQKVVHLTLVKEKLAVLILYENIVVQAK